MQAGPKEWKKPLLGGHCELQHCSDEKTSDYQIAESMPLASGGISLSCH